MIHHCHLLRSSLGEGNSEVLDLVAIHAYQVNSVKLLPLAQLCLLPKISTKEITFAINQMCNAALQMLGLNFYSQGGEPGTITLNPGDQLRQNKTSLYTFYTYVIGFLCI